MKRVIPVIIILFALNVFLFIDKDILSLDTAMISQTTNTSIPTPTIEPLKPEEFNLSKLIHNQVVINRSSGNITVKLFAAREILQKVENLDNAYAGQWIGDTSVSGYYMLKIFKNDKEIYSRPISFNWDPVSSPNSQTYTLNNQKYTKWSLGFIINGKPGSGRPHNGITLKKIPGYPESLIAIYFYGTSSVEEIAFYRVTELEEIVPLMFENENFKYQYMCDSSDCEHPKEQLINSEDDIYREWEDTDYDGEFYVYNSMPQFCSYTGMNSVIGFVCRSYKYADGVLKYDSTQKYYAEQNKPGGGWGKGEMVK